MAIITPPLENYAKDKSEEISCNLKLLYDGSEQALLPFLTKLSNWQKNNEWVASTKLKIS
jgi:hypothetical protein